MSKRKRVSAKKSVKRSNKSRANRSRAKTCKGKSCSKVNVGKLDRVARLLIAIIALVLGYYYSPWWYILTILGLYTAVTARCEPYAWLGIRTN